MSTFPVPVYQSQRSAIILSSVSLTTITYFSHGQEQSLLDHEDSTCLNCHCKTLYQLCSMTDPAVSHLWSIA